MIWVIGGALVIAALFVGWWLLLGADKSGLFPKNQLKQIRRDDGGLGPIAKRDLT